MKESNINMKDIKYSVQYKERERKKKDDEKINGRYNERSHKTAE